MVTRGTLIDHGRYALRFFLPYRITLIGAVLIGIVELILAHSIPLILRHLIDVVIPQGSVDSLVPTIGLLFAVVIVSSILTLVYLYLTLVVKERSSLDISTMLFGKVEHASLRSMENEKPGDLMTTIESDASATTNFAMLLVDDIPINIVVLVYIFGILLVMDYRLLFLSALIIPFLIASQLRFGTMIRSKSDELRTAFGEYFSFMEERIRHVKLVQLFNREEDETRRFTKRGETVVEKSMRIAVLQEAAVAVSTFLTHFSLALVLGVSAFLVVRGELTIGTMVAFYGYQVSLYSPIKKLMNTHSALKQAQTSVVRVRKLEESAIPIPEPVAASPMPNPPYLLAFERVSYAWGDAQVFTDVSVRLEQGVIVGITGPSGSGKSTLLQLIYRLIDPDSGRVLLNGMDIRSFASNEYRHLVAFVPSKPALFSGSIAQNILFGHANATMDEVIQAAKFADLDGFISSLPKGYDTDIGNIEDELSEGQLARLAVARALIKRPAIYLFDETTAGLDAETEAHIRRMWWLLRSSGSTIVVTSHRIGALRDTDRIIVLAGGLVVERGSYDELMSRDSLLKKLFEIQERD